MGRHTLLLLGLLALPGGTELVAQTREAQATAQRGPVAGAAQEPMPPAGGRSLNEIAKAGNQVRTPWPTLTFSNGQLPTGTTTTYKFTTETDNGIVRLLVDSAGTAEGAVPSGWAEVQLRAQDEIRDRKGRVLSSSDVSGRIITTSKSFGYTDDPKIGHCRPGDYGEHCPETTHLESKNLRLMSLEQMEILVGGRKRLLFSQDKLYLPDLRASHGASTPLCVDDAGAVSPCDSPTHSALYATTQGQNADALRLQTIAWGPPSRDLFSVRGDGRVQVPGLAGAPGTVSAICADEQGNFLQRASCGPIRTQIILTTLVTTFSVNLLFIAVIALFWRRTRIARSVVGIVLLSLASSRAARAQAPPPPHDLLSTAHSDTSQSSPARGDFLVGGSAAKWTAQTRCERGQFIGSNGADTLCSADGSALTNLSAAGLLSGTIDDARLPANVPRLNGQNPTFNPGRLGTGTGTTWTFKTATDDAVATLVVSSEGTTVGATPNGFAQLQVNAQDEVPTPGGPPLGSNMSGYFRVMAQTFNNGQCRGTMCPDTAELSSDKNLRLTVGGSGKLTFLKNNATAFLLDDDGLHARTFFQSSSPDSDLEREAVALRVDTSATRNTARNIGISVTGWNLRDGGATAVQVLPRDTNGLDYGVDISAQEGVEIPLAVRTGSIGRFLVCGDGGVVVGLECAASKGAGSINVARGLYKDGDARGFVDHEQALASSLDRAERRLVELQDRIEELARRLNELEHR